MSLFKISAIYINLESQIFLFELIKHKGSQFSYTERSGLSIFPNFKSQVFLNFEKYTSKVSYAQNLSFL